jgi:hypothetical protein
VKFRWGTQPPWAAPSSSDLELANNEMLLTSAAPAKDAFADA